MTESDAFTKRCCGPEGCGETKSGSMEPRERWCIGAACMAWRTFKISDYQGARINIDPDGRIRDGYCGLAGRP